VRTAAQARTCHHRVKKSSLDGELLRGVKGSDRIIGIGASTGGIEAIKYIVSTLPANCAGIVVSQHLPALFSRTLAKNINEITQMNASLAEDGQRIIKGHIYISPGDYHLTVVRDGTNYHCCLDRRPRINRHRPSVDRLFESLANSVGRSAVGVILSGMGKDGAVGLLSLHQVGAATIIQDEQSSVVWGMPGQAARLLGQSDAIIPLDKIAKRVLEAIQ